MRLCFQHAFVSCIAVLRRVLRIHVFSCFVCLCVLRLCGKHLLAFFFLQVSCPGNMSENKKIVAPCHALSVVQKWAGVKDIRVLGKGRQGLANLVSMKVGMFGHNLDYTVSFERRRCSAWQGVVFNHSCSLDRRKHLQHDAHSRSA